jgi:hypothetical protein
MSEISLVEQAENAAKAVETAKQKAEDDFLRSVTDLKQLSDGTQVQASRRKSRYISLMGIGCWTALVSNTRR